MSGSAENPTGPALGSAAMSSPQSLAVHHRVTGASYDDDMTINQTPSAPLGLNPSTDEVNDYATALRTRLENGEELDVDALFDDASSPSVVRSAIWTVTSGGRAQLAVRRSDAGCSYVLRGIGEPAA